MLNEYKQWYNNEISHSQLLKWFLFAFVPPIATGVVALAMFENIMVSPIGIIHTQMGVTYLKQTKQYIRCCSGY